MAVSFTTRRLPEVHLQLLDVTHRGNAQPAKGLRAVRDYVHEEKGFGLRRIVAVKNIQEVLLVLGHGEAHHVIVSGGNIIAGDQVGRASSCLNSSAEEVPGSVHLEANGVAAQWRALDLIHRRHDAIRHAVRELRIVLVGGVLAQKVCHTERGHRRRPSKRRT